MANNAATGYYSDQQDSFPNFTWKSSRASLGFFGWPTLEVEVIKSYDTDWTEALGQYGGGDAKVRVCVGGLAFDFTVGPTTLTAPAGWATDGFSFAKADIAIADGLSAPIPSNYTLPFPGFYPELSELPFQELFDIYNNAISPSKSTGKVTVFAYQIDAPSGEYQNAPGWVPNWTIVTDPDTGQKNVVGNQEGPIDKEMTSIFETRVTVSQSAYSVSSVGYYVKFDTGYAAADPAESLSLAEFDEKRKAKIVIRLDGQTWVSGKPYINSKGPVVENKNPRDDDGETTVTQTKRPPRNTDNDDTKQFRPILGSGGNGIPVYEDFIALEVNPEIISFPDTDINNQRSQSFTVKNIGTSPVEITSIVSGGLDNSFAFGLNSPNSLPTTIEPGETFAGTAFFLPTDDILYNELAYVKSGDTIVKTFNVTGTGTLSGNPGDGIFRTIALYGDVPSSGDTNFLEQTIGEVAEADILAVNAGSTPIILNSVSLGGSGVFTSTGIISGFNLLPGEDTIIKVFFEPVGAQEYFGTLTLNSNAEASNQAGFNPSTGAITCNLKGKGTILESLTRIMSLNVENNGTFPNTLAGGSATTELTATITNIGNSTLMIRQFQVGSPFSLELDAFGTYTFGSLTFYTLDEPLLILPEKTSQPFKIKFTPTTATNYVDDVLIVSNKTIGTEAFEVRGLGTVEIEEPSEPIEPILPDDEPPPGQEFDPGSGPSSALDGNGSTCIPKECEVNYVYEYSSNGDIVT